MYGGQNSVGQFDAVLTCFFLDTAHNVLVSTACCSRLHLLVLSSEYVSQLAPVRQQLFDLPCPCMQEYIEVLYRILRPGGFWINLGPLLW